MEAVKTGIVIVCGRPAVAETAVVPSRSEAVRLRRSLRSSLSVVFLRRRTQ